MGIVRKTALAEQDLLDLWVHIARENEAAADKLYNQIEDRSRLYADQKLMGAERPELMDGLRAFFVRPYWLANLMMSAVRAYSSAPPVARGSVLS